jgi:hypothetical protein
MLSSQRRAIPIARILRFHGRAAWRYPGLVVGCLLATPLTVLVETILPPLIVSDVLNRLAPVTTSATSSGPASPPT